MTSPTIGTITTAGGAADSTGKTFSHTVEVGCNLLIARVALRGATLLPTAVTISYGGVTMPQVAAAQTGSTSFLWLRWFYLLNPPSGAHNIVVGWTNTSAFALAGFDVMGTPDLTPNGGNGTVASLTHYSVPIASRYGDLVIDSIAAAVAPSSSDQTIIVNQTGAGTNSVLVATSIAFGQPTVNMGYTYGGSSQRVMAGFNIPSDDGNMFSMF